MHQVSTVERRLAGAIAAVRNSQTAIEAAHAPAEHARHYASATAEQRRHAEGMAALLSVEHLLPCGGPAQGCTRSPQRASASGLLPHPQGTYARKAPEHAQHQAPSVAQLWCGPHAPGSPLPIVPRSSRSGHSSEPEQQPAPGRGRFDHAACYGASAVTEQLQHGLAFAAAAHPAHCAVTQDIHVHAAAGCSERQQCPPAERTPHSVCGHAAVAQNATLFMPLADSSNLASRQAGIDHSRSLARSSTDWAQVDERVQRLLQCNAR